MIQDMLGHEFYDGVTRMDQHGERITRSPSSKDAAVKDAIRHGEWNLPAARSPQVQEFQIALTLINPPDPNSGDDIFLWRNNAGRSSCLQYSVLPEDGGQTDKEGALRHTSHRQSCNTECCPRYLSSLTTISDVEVSNDLQKQQKRKEEETENLTSLNDDLGRGAGPRKISYKDLAPGANNFSDGRKLGEGGFGAVYKGYLNGLDMMIAIKKFAGGSKQGKREFITEVKIITAV